MIKTIIAVAAIFSWGLVATNPVAARAHSSHSVYSTGNDVSYPQCGHQLPAAQSFAIVGINNGSTRGYNPCIDKELAWASTSTGITSQPKVALYANTGNPGDILPKVSDWPTTSAQFMDPYGICMGGNDAACSWEYGYQRGYADVATSPITSQIWWMDVETSNSWSSNLANNRADLEGMLYAFTIGGSRVGVYSTPNWWSQISGDVPAASSLYDLVEWRAGSQNENEAKSACKEQSLTGGGQIDIVQFNAGPIDTDMTCP